MPQKAPSSLLTRLVQRLAHLASVPFILGAILVGASGVIHLRLWTSFGYRHIPTIGPLFLLQGISFLVLSVLLTLTRRVWGAILGAGAVLSTISAFFLSVTRGIFGFHEIWSDPFTVSTLVIESAALVLFAATALLARRAPHS